MAERPPGDPAPGRLRVVFVCTGNRARSALAEAMLRSKTDGSEMEVASYGTADLGAIGALPETLIAGARHGVDLHAHRASPLTPGAVGDADLVLGFEPFHVAAAVVDGGASRARTFTIVEFAELLDDVPRSGHDDDPRRLIALAHSRRRQSGLSAPSIGDPLGRPQRVFDALADDIAGLLDRIVWNLLPRARRAGDRAGRADRVEPTQPGL